jgi:hypothetical protein
VGVADGGGEVAVLPLRVLPLTGNLDGVMPSAVTLDGSSPKLHAVGFGLQPPQEHRTGNDGHMPVPVPRGNSDGSTGGMAPPVACAVGQMAAEVADRVVEGGGAVLCPSARAPSAGFWVMAVGTEAGHGAGLTAARSQIETIPAPIVRTISPGTTPARGGGLVWATGVNLASGHLGRGELCTMAAGGSGGGGGGAASGHANAVSSALVACEVPAWWAPDPNTNPPSGHRDKDEAAAAAAQLEKLTAAQPVTVGVYVSPSGLHSHPGFGGVEGANPRSRLEYLAEASISGGASPRRGPTTGGTPVRLSGAGLGWAASVGSAGCRFGSIAVSLRVATDLAGGVECITPAKKFGKVELAVASDLRSVSQPLTYTERGTPVPYLFAVF